MLLQTSADYIGWQRKAHLLEFDGRPLKRLLSAYDLNRELLYRFQDAGDPLLEPLLRSQLANLYLVRNVEIEGLITSDFPAHVAERDLDPRSLGSPEEKLLRLQQSAFSRGRALLEQLGSLHRGGDPVALAEVQLELGDWHQWGRRAADALKHYRRAWRGLHEAGRQDLLRQWFGEPQELPANRVFQLPRYRGDDRERSQLTVSFNVSRTGRVQKLDTSALTKEQEKPGHRLYRLLRGTRFRPRLEAGEPVDTIVLERDYIVFH